MSSESTKTPAVSLGSTSRSDSASEVQLHQSHNSNQLHPKSVRRTLESIRLGLTILALLSGLTILATSTDTLSVYNETHLPAEFHLPLWPDQFDVRPTITLVVCSVIIVVAGAITIIAGRLCKEPNRRGPRKTLLAATLALGPPLTSFVAALTATSVFYAVNASSATETLQSWSCQWQYIRMDLQPHFNTLCKESQVALYLMVVLVPVEIAVIGLATWDLIGEKSSRGAEGSKVDQLGEVKV